MWTYLGEGHFWEALFENWESEFLQMAAYIVLTVFLIQKGSAESKDPDKHESVDDDRATRTCASRCPWPVRRGGIWLVLYENSLADRVRRVVHRLDRRSRVRWRSPRTTPTCDSMAKPPMTLWNYVTGAEFWFESFQNWQSEFLAVFAIVVLSIWLRQKGSPESKPVAAPHSATGSS